MRLIFVLLALFAAGGVLLYLILWLIMPGTKVCNDLAPGVYSVASRLAMWCSSHRPPKEIAALGRGAG